MGSEENNKNFLKRLCKQQLRRKLSKGKACPEIKLDKNAIQIKSKPIDLLRLRFNFFFVLKQEIIHQNP